jgi:RNA polymerase sigma-70 factor, ECF subfamily
MALPSQSNLSYATSASLLERLRETGQKDAWARFVRLYTPLLFYWARKANLKESDACDLVQEVFVLLLEKLPTFRYQKDGGFRSWLRTVTLNKLRDLQRRQTRQATRDLARGVEPELPDHAEAFWDNEYRSEVVHRALDLIKTDFEEATWKACWESLVHERPAAQIARELGISENAVYLAKFRVLKRLRHEFDGLLD